MSSEIRDSEGKLDLYDELIYVQVNARIIDIAENYLAHRVRDGASVLKALDRGEFEYISNVAHDLVGTGGSFGFEVLSKIGCSMESAAANRQTEEIKRLVGELLEYLSRVEVVYE